MKTTAFKSPKIVSPKQWLAARKKLLREEKAFTRLGDRLAARQRSMPWVKMKPYTFAGLGGNVTLADLFDGRSQLIVQHFMLGSGWEQGCKSCSFMTDHFNPTVVHLQARDVNFAVISQASLNEILPFKKRMGWEINWVSSQGTGFNQDFNVSFTEEEIERGGVSYNYGKMDFPQTEAPGISVFARDAKGDVYHTYSTFGRGVEVVMTTYDLLDLVPKGRDEDPEGTMNWVRYHDSYGQPADANATH